MFQLVQCVPFGLILVVGQGKIYCLTIFNINQSIFCGNRLVFTNLTVSHSYKLQGSHILVATGAKKHNGCDVNQHEPLIQTHCFTLCTMRKVNIMDHRLLQISH